jgi:acyl carrier protein phosphodiesterase
MATQPVRADSRTSRQNRRIKSLPIDLQCWLDVVIVKSWKQIATVPTSLQYALDMAQKCITQLKAHPLPFVASIAEYTQQTKHKCRANVARQTFLQKYG